MKKALYTGDSETLNVYAYGPGHERFEGNRDNTHVGLELAELRLEERRTAGGNGRDHVHGHILTRIDLIFMIAGGGLTLIGAVLAVAGMLRGPTAAE